MGLNISKGNMYPFVSHTWNTVKGKCPHDCSYCYMKQYGTQKDIRFDKKELQTDLGTDNFIFVGSSCDMWAEEIPSGWIIGTLDHLKLYGNQHLLQSKNPGRMMDYINLIPSDSVLGTTIETNRIGYRQTGTAPSPLNRSKHLALLSNAFTTMVTVEPIMDFDVKELVEMIISCNPAWVNIGADSKGHNLPEPSSKKVDKLIRCLKTDGHTVKLKDNLKRLLEV